MNEPITSVALSKAILYGITAIVGGIVHALIAHRKGLTKGPADILALTFISGFAGAMWILVAVYFQPQNQIIHLFAGGMGGYQYNASVAVSAGSYTVTIGAGGTAGLTAGGASTSGGDGSNSVWDSGGATQITGSAVYYGGGGGAGAETGSPVPGGQGGGGAGGVTSSTSAAASNGTANTGGGGGGATNFSNGGAGGSGIVIIAYTTADFTHSYSGSSTTGTNGSETWVSMTTSGTLTLTGGSGPTANSNFLMFM